RGSARADRRDQGSRLRDARRTVPAGVARAGLNRPRRDRRGGRGGHVHPDRPGVRGAALVRVPERCGSLPGNGRRAGGARRARGARPLSRVIDRRTVISHLFVYGTLRPGDVRWPMLAPWVVDDGRDDTVAGLLFDTGL